MKFLSIFTLSIYLGSSYAALTSADNAIIHDFFNKIDGKSNVVTTLLFNISNSTATNVKCCDYPKEKYKILKIKDCTNGVNAVFFNSNLPKEMSLKICTDCHEKVNANFTQLHDIDAFKSAPKDCFRYIKVNEKFYVTGRCDGHFKLLEMVKNEENEHFNIPNNTYTFISSEQLLNLQLEFFFGDCKNIFFDQKVTDQRNFTLLKNSLDGFTTPIAETEARPNPPLPSFLENEAAEANIDVPNPSNIYYA